MADLGSQLNQLSPQQRQAVLMQAQQEANQKIMEEMMKRMVTSCYDKCAGTSVRVLPCSMNALGISCVPSHLFRFSEDPTITASSRYLFLSLYIHNTNFRKWTNVHAQQQHVKHINFL
jgi:hypothetical protein